MASLQPEPRGRSRASSAASSIMSNTSNSKRTFFDSLKDRVKRRPSRSPSPSPNKMCYNPFTTPSPITARDMGATAAAGPPSGAPPPYSEQPPPVPNPSISINQPPNSSTIRNPSPTPSATSILSTPEDPYAFLSLFDTIFLIDDSGSMSSQNRWKEVKSALSSIAPICTAHDSDGVDVYFLNAKNPAHPSTGFIGKQTAASINQLFTDVFPSGWTPTGQRINNILGPYVKRYVEAVNRGAEPDNTGIKPVNLIVITDGAASDDPEAVIVSLARKLDEVEAPSHQVGVQFFQVGNDGEAGRALRELDDGLKGVRDMVDTVSFDQRAAWADGGGRVLSADAILKTVLGAVVKRLDRRSVGERQGGLLAPRG
ncbi:hypothetical protein B0T21DRAFT_356764 [Apiosordaria backusii]|uniref:VWFA domain-containing protein n=1 Tax=Apiosordaria backusii TaxID=314023 RepID=A0AA40K7S3_9PEZI|nr:hypothetical protein B0T21DRAFT_356764 [Apiosordaria backusii]